jgi:hypothetical protein
MGSASFALMGLLRPGQFMLSGGAGDEDDVMACGLSHTRPGPPPVRTPILHTVRWYDDAAGARAPPVQAEDRSARAACVNGRVHGR